MRWSHGLSVAAAAVVAATLGLSSLHAQSQSQTPKVEQGKEVTLTGKIVDLQCYMTGAYPSKDEAKSTRECIRHGVPVALETENGLVMIGMGYKKPGPKLLKHAFALVEITGRLYVKGGVKYIDMTTVKAAKPTEEEEWEEEEDPPFEDPR